MNNLRNALPSGCRIIAALLLLGAVAWISRYREPSLYGAEPRSVGPPPLPLVPPVLEGLSPVECHIPANRRAVRAGLDLRNTFRCAPCLGMMYCDPRKCGFAPLWSIEPVTIPEPAKQTAPVYDAKGHLILPVGFDTWTFVGANLGLAYDKELADTTPREQGRKKQIGDFHNVYINPDAYKHFRATRNFPEKTVLVMDVYAAKDREPQNVLSAGFYPGERLGIEVAVKNSKRPDGMKTDWAYYVFDLKDPTPAPARKDNECYQCHRKHASIDNVWVQFYPTLRNIKVQ